MLNLETGFWHGSESDTWTPGERNNGVTKSTPGDVSRLSDERENYVKPQILCLGHCCYKQKVRSRLLYAGRATAFAGQIECKQLVSDCANG